MYMKQIISLIIAFALIIGSEGPLFAAGLRVELGKSEVVFGEGLGREDLNKLEERIESLRAGGGDRYLAEIKGRAALEKKKVLGSKEVKAIKRYKGIGEAKYGVLSAMYVRKQGAGAIRKLEGELLKYIGEELGEKILMSKVEYEKEYERGIREALKGEAGKGIEARIRKEYSLDRSYADYVREGKAEQEWRKSHSQDIEGEAYGVIRAYIEGIGAEHISSGVLGLLIGLKVGGKGVISGGERLRIYGYTVKRMEEQRLDILKEDSQTGRGLIEDIIDTMMAGSYVSGGDGGRYGRAVEAVIHRSEGGIGYGTILSWGISILLGAKEYGVIGRLMERYDRNEVKGRGWVEYVTSTKVYTDGMRTLGGKYLGEMSRRVQYKGDYGYGNVFTDIGVMMGEEGSKEIKGILRKYGIRGKIKPFIVGVLLSGEEIGSEEERNKAALGIVNAKLGDIAGIQEYDIDRELVRKYPKIKGLVGSGYIKDKEELKRRQAESRGYDLIGRIGNAVDIGLMIWGGVGIIKLSGRGIKLGRSTYTAIRAGRIAESGKRIAYIKMNYGKLGSYISARRSMARLGLKIKELMRIGVEEGSKRIKLERSIEGSRQAALAARNKKLAIEAEVSGSKKKGALLEVGEKLHAYREQGIGLRRSLSSGEGKGLIRKYEAYKRGEEGLRIEGLSAGERRVAGEAYGYGVAGKELGLALDRYYPYMGIMSKLGLGINKKIRGVREWIRGKGWLNRVRGERDIWSEYEEIRVYLVSKAREEQGKVCLCRRVLGRHLTQRKPHLRFRQLLLEQIWAAVII